MKRILVLVAVVLLCVFVECETQTHTQTRLFVGEANNGDGFSLALQLKSLGYEIYGYYEELVIASTTISVTTKTLSVTTKTISHTTPSQVNHTKLIDIGERKEDASYYVLERGQPYDTARPLFISNIPSVAILYLSSNRWIIRSPTDLDLPLFLDSEIVALPIPSSPIILGIREDLKDITSKIYSRAKDQILSGDLDVTIEAMVEAVTGEGLKEIVTYLSGEHTSSPLLTRNSLSQGAKDAALWIGKQYESYGLQVSYQHFREGYSDNVIGIRKGETEPDKVIVFGYHYDDRAASSTSPTQRAPGANDNGSGTGAGLLVAKIFHDFNASFAYTIIFAAFSGEEQGLYGSAAYVQQLVADRVQVVAMVNADMIAYRAPGNAAQLDFPTRYSTLALQEVVASAVAKYVPTLRVSTTNACCSDHQSFYNAGFPAVGCIEGGGYTIDPRYHHELDLVNREGYDLNEQYKYITQTLLATVAILAKVDVN
jgi:hypothetical protein